LAAALTGARLLRSILFQVQPNDPVVYAGVAVLVGAAALVAGLIPARRAVKIDPVAALRRE
jgi:ABC-type lipoprotein release transport system permease subunit